MTRVSKSIQLSVILAMTFVVSCVEKKIDNKLQNQSQAHKKPPAQHSAPAKNRGHGIYHTVGPGQTLWRICKAYGVDMEQVAKVNGISDPTQISVGEKIFIPGATGLKSVDPYQVPQPAKGSTPEPPKVVPKSNPEQPDVFMPNTATYTSGKLCWPVEGAKVYSPFGTRKGIFHEGVDLSAPQGTPIYAAEDGKVVYSDNTIRGYGNMIVIKHSGNLSTVYAHNRMNLVKEGDFVRRGDKIAEVGQTGKATGPHCHFEVRVGKEAVDPLKYMERSKK